MQVTTTPIKDLLIIEPKVYKDKRGYFMETYNHRRLVEVLGVDFVQDNESLSQKNVLRGLHFQKPPHAQDKLVRVINGSILDVVVDLRKNSKSYGQHHKVILSAENKKQFFIPKGFAHGFLSMEDKTIVSYKCSDYYHKSSEDSLRWNDKLLAIDWPTTHPIISEKDAIANFFTTFSSPF